MPDANDWKQRSEAAGSALATLRNEHRELREEIEHAVARACRTAAGLDAELDAHLDELRRLLRKPHTAAVFASKLELIDERLRTLHKRRDGFAAAAATAVDALLARLAAQPAPPELRRRVEALRNVARRKLADPNALPAIIESAAAMHGEMLAAGAVAAPARAGLLGRLFGGGSQPADAPAPAAATPAASAAQEDDGAQDLDPAAARSLDALLDTVEAPAADAMHRPLYEAAKQRLAGSAHWTDVGPLADDARRLAAAALARGRDEFENFLLGLDERLGGIDAAVQGSVEVSQRRAEAGNAFDDALRNDMQTMQDSVGSATELEQLKAQVRARIAHITESMDAFRRDDQQLHAELGSRIGELSMRVRELEQQAREAEARIAEQRRLALTDALTKLPNREAFARRLEEETTRASRYGHPLALAICDIDFFKKVNDSHGHLAGDAVLVAIAQLLRARLRGSDFLARFGGEEFVILLIETAAADAVAVLESVREAIAAAPVAFAGGSIPVTASFGVAGFDAGGDPLRVFDRADGALYQSKRDGRNRVTLYGAEPAA